MPMPRSVVKVRKNGVEYVSSVDRVKYTLRELIARANYDVAKFLLNRMKQATKKSPSMSRLPKSRGRNIFQYWVRKKENDLQVGIKANTWYGVDQEFGTKNQPRRGILRDTVYNNIPDIRRIEGAYLSAIDDENKALELINKPEEAESSDGA